MPDLVGLVIVDREAVALIGADPVNVAALTRTSPEVGVFDPVISSNSVVLPEPFGPIMPTIPALRRGTWP